MSLDVKCYPMGVYFENTYLITDEATNYKAIIDPGYFGTDVRMDIESNAFLKYVILTHGHEDHFEAAKDYLDEYSGAKFAAPAKEMPLLEKTNCPKPTQLLNEGDEIVLGATTIKVLSTPGHTAGGICSPVTFSFRATRSLGSAWAGATSRRETGMNWWNPSTTSYIR